MADPSATWQNLQNVFGLDQGQVQSLQKAGFTPDQATQLMNLSVGGGSGPAGGTGYVGTGQLSPTIGGSGLTPSMLASLASLLGGRGGGQGQGQGQGQGGPQIVSGVGAPDQPSANQQAAGQGGGNQPVGGGQGVQPISGFSPAVSGGGSGGTQQVTGAAVDPNQVMINLGARALNERAVYPPTPGPADPTSGVSSGIGQTSATGATPTTITAGVPTARDVGLAGKNLGPWATTPGVFTRAPTLQPTTPTGVSPFTPAPQATGTQVARPQPWATAPAAPGINVQGVVPPMMGRMMPSMQGQPQPMGAPGTGAAAINAQTALTTGQPAGFDAAHNLALAHAGMSLYAHYGGNPFSASPADIAGFHNELQGALAGGKPIKMRSGGLVPGSGNKDNVPALLTPGEYVLTKEQASQLFDGRTPVKMQSGGSVTEDDQPPEVPKPTPESDTGAVGKSYQVTPPSDQATPPPAPGKSGRARRTSAEDYANWANQGGQMGGKQGAVYDAQGNLVTSSGNLTAQAAAGSGATMMPGGGIRDASGNVYDSNAILAAQDVGGAGATMPGAGAGAGAGGMGSAISSGIGGIASAISQAAQTYADSIKPWTWQKSAIPNPPSSQGQQPAARLAQVQAQPSRRQQTISPFAPYYPYTS
jgi:hypothetical protein